MVIPVLSLAARCIAAKIGDKIGSNRRRLGKKWIFPRRANFLCRIGRKISWQMILIECRQRPVQEFRELAVVEPGIGDAWNPRQISPAAINLEKARDKTRHRRSAVRTP